MNPLRSTALVLGLLASFGFASTASAHDDCPDLLTAARNLERAVHRLNDTVNYQHHSCEVVLDASQHLEELACGFRSSVVRRIHPSRLRASFQHIVTDFRQLIRHVRHEGVSPRVQRDLLIVRDRLMVVGRFVGQAPQFGHDCDFDDHRGHDHGDHFDRDNFDRGGFGRGSFGPAPHDLPVRVPGNPALQNGPAFQNGPVIQPFPAPQFNRPAGAQFGIRTGSFQLQFRSR